MVSAQDFNAVRTAAFLRSLQATNQSLKVSLASATATKVRYSSSVTADFATSEHGMRPPASLPSGQAPRSAHSHDVGVCLYAGSCS